MKSVSLVIFCAGMAAAQFNSAGQANANEKATVPPVAINKFINQQNNDGSYTYGFEGADGTFRLETRDQGGNVQGKYGYYDANNELKVVEYTAGNSKGFEAKADFLPEPQQPIAPQSQPSRPQAPTAPRAGNQFANARPVAPAPSAAHPPQPNSVNGRRPFPVSSPVFNVETPVFPNRPAAPAPGGVPFTGEYVPSIALEGFSEDKDKDGFVDEIPSDGSLPIRNRPTQSRPIFSQQFGAPPVANARPIPQAPAPQQRPSHFGAFPGAQPQPQPQPQRQQHFAHLAHLQGLQQQHGGNRNGQRFQTTAQGTPIFRSTSPQAISPAFAGIRGNSLNGAGGNQFRSPVPGFPQGSSDAIPSIPSRNSPQFNGGAPSSAFGGAPSGFGGPGPAQNFRGSGFRGGFGGNPLPFPGFRPGFQG